MTRAKRLCPVDTVDEQLQLLEQDRIKIGAERFPEHTIKNTLVVIPTLYSHKHDWHKFSDECVANCAFGHHFWMRPAKGQDMVAISLVSGARRILAWLDDTHMKSPYALFISALMLAGGSNTDPAIRPINKWSLHELLLHWFVEDGTTPSPEFYASLLAQREKYVRALLEVSTDELNGVFAQILTSMPRELRAHAIGLIAELKNRRPS